MTTHDKSRHGVFLVSHVRNRWANRAMTSFLKSLGLHVVTWNDARAATGKGTPSVLEVVQSGFDHAAQAVVLLTPDDEARLRSEYEELSAHASSDEPMTRTILQPRPNVLFEAGIAFALFPERTVLVRLADLEEAMLPSDLEGLLPVELDNGAEKRRELGMRLLCAEWAQIEKSRGWRRAGRFARPEVTVHLDVAVPTSTGENTVHIAGTHDRLAGGGPVWNPGSHPLERRPNGHWTVELKGKQGSTIEYKFTLGSWETVEKGPQCEELPNRSLTLRADAHHRLFVYKWRGLDCR